MTYDDLMATDRIREHWARLMKSVCPELYEYMTRAKHEYLHIGAADRWTGDPDLFVENVIDWANKEFEH